MGEIIRFDQEPAFRAQEWMAIKHNAYSLQVLKAPEALGMQQTLYELQNIPVTVFTEVEARYLQELPESAEEDLLLHEARLIPVSRMSSTLKYPAVSLVLDIPVSDVWEMQKRRRTELLSHAYVVTIMPGGGMQFREQMRTTNMRTGKRKIHRTSERVQMLPRYSLTPELVADRIDRLFHPTS